MYRRLQVLTTILFRIRKVWLSKLGQWMAIAAEVFLGEGGVGVPLIKCCQNT